MAIPDTARYYCTTSLQRSVEVVGLHAGVGKIGSAGSTEPVAAVLHDQIDVAAPGLGQRVEAAGLDDHFLNHRWIFAGQDVSRGQQTVGIHAISKLLKIGAAAA